MTTLHPHQVPHASALVAALRRQGAALDASDTGTGKTFVAVAVAKALGVVPLVICPKSVVPGWNKAASALGWEVDAVGYEKARGQCKVTHIERADDGEPATIRKTESIYGREHKIGTGSQWLWKHPFEAIFFDEVHRCGGMTSLQAKMLIAAKRQAKYVLCLSATATDRPEKMKALGYALGLFEMPKFKWWLMAHGVKPGVFGGFKFTDDVEDQRLAMLKLNQAIFPARGARMRKAEIPGFPKTSIAPLLIEDATGKAAALLEEIRDLYTKRETQARDAAARESVLEMLLRKRQALELLKVGDLADLAVDYAGSSKVVIFCHFKETIAALLKKLPKDFGPVPVIDGGNSAAGREFIKIEFQRNRYPVLICNAAAGGVGLDLHDPTGAVERTALISPGWSATQLKQVFGRVQRDGGGYSQQLLVGFAGTLEEEILERARANIDNIDLLNDAVFSGSF